MGIGAMGRDESLVSYILRLCMSMLFNFTLGVCGAVIAFVFGLVWLVQSYQSNFLVALLFFLIATIAAISFALTWLIGLYVASAGTVYVG